MDVPQYPSNSDKSKAEQRESAERITAKPAIRAKRSLVRDWKAEAASLLRVVASDVIFPAAKDMIAATVSQGIDRILYGESGRRPSVGSRSRNDDRPPFYTTNRYNYNYTTPGPRREAPYSHRPTRPANKVDDVIVSHREEAESVLDAMVRSAERYEYATVANLYEMVGVHSTFIDGKWGWRSDMLSGRARIVPVRNGYLIDLPRPEPING